MKLTTKSEYCLLALVFMCQHGNGEYLKIDPICEYYDIPKKYLEQLFTVLKNNGIIKTRRGAAGGYMFNQDPKTISVAKIVRLLDGPLAPSSSVSKNFYNKTPIEKEKKLQNFFQEIRDMISDRMEKTYLTDLI